MNSDEYAYLHACGADYVTVFQETYNSDKYETQMCIRDRCIGSNTVPELMNVNATQYRALLKYDMIQPLDERCV